MDTHTHRYEYTQRCINTHFQIHICKLFCYNITLISSTFLTTSYFKPFCKDMWWPSGLQTVKCHFSCYFCVNLLSWQKEGSALSFHLFFFSECNQLFTPNVGECSGDSCPPVLPPLFPGTMSAIWHENMARCSSSLTPGSRTTASTAALPLMV